MTDVAAKHMKFTRRGVKGDAPPLPNRKIWNVHTT